MIKIIALILLGANVYTGYILLDYRVKYEESHSKLQYELSKAPSKCSPVYMAAYLEPDCSPLIPFRSTICPGRITVYRMGSLAEVLSRAQDIGPARKLVIYKETGIRESQINFNWSPKVQ